MKNKAVEEFCGEGGEAEPQDLRQYNSWYSPEIVKYLAYLQPRSRQTLKYIFSQQTEESASGSFNTQLEQFKVLGNSLGADISCFVCFEPGEVATHHYIVGAIVENKLFIINPLGITGHEPFYNIIKKVTERHSIQQVYLSNTLIQRDPDGIVSCGPICVEIINHISALNIEHFTEIISSLGEDPEYQEHNGLRYGLRFLEFSAESLLPDNLKALPPLNSEHYQEAIVGIRADHLRRLQAVQGNTIEEQDRFLDSLLNSPVQVLMNRLSVGGERILEIRESEEFKALNQEMRGVVSGSGRTGNVGSEGELLAAAGAGAGRPRGREAGAVRKYQDSNIDFPVLGEKFEIEGEEILTIRIKGDGNCFFRALSEISRCTHDLKIFTHTELRNRTVRDIKRNKILRAKLIRVLGTELERDEEQVKEEDIMNYLDNMEQVGRYASEPEIFACSKILKAKIQIYQNNGQQLMPLPEYNYYTLEEVPAEEKKGINANELPTVRLIFQPYMGGSGRGKNHYNLLVSSELASFFREERETYGGIGWNHENESRTVELPAAAGAGAGGPNTPGTDQSIQHSAVVRRDRQEGFTSAGLTHTLHGDLYQLALLTIVAYRADNTSKPFYLVSEAKEFEKFDDLVVDYGDKIIFLQAKHSLGGKKYKKNDFCAARDADASLAKYFDSWLRLESGNFSRNADGTSKDRRYIFFTNKGVKDDSVFLEDCEYAEDELLFAGVNTKTMRFKRGAIRIQFIDAIRAYSEEINERAKQVSQDNFDLSQFEEELINATEYLGRRLPEFSRTKEPITKLHVNGRAHLSKKVMAIIKLALTDDAVESALKNKMDPQTQNLFDQYKSHITVRIDNPVSVLMPIMQDKIEQFLDEFVIKIEQPGHNDLVGILRDELHFNVNIGSRELYYALHGYMLTWLASPKECLLRFESFGNFIAANKGDLERFYLLGGTQKYEKEYVDFPINLSELEVSGLYEFLDNSESHPLALVGYAPGIRARVYQTVNRYKQKIDLKDAEWGFLTINSPYLDKVPDILMGESTKFIIIDCSQADFEEFPPPESIRIIQDIAQSAKDHNKKLILLVKKESTEAVKISVSGNGGGDDNVDEEDSKDICEFEASQLSDEQLESVCRSFSDKWLNLGGKYYQVSSILMQKDSGIYRVMTNLDYLVEISRSLTDTKPSKPLDPPYDLPYGIYVENPLVRGISYYSLRSVLESAEAQLFIIEGVDKGNLSETLSNRFNTKKHPRRFVIGLEHTEDGVRCRLISDFTGIRFEEFKEKLIYVLSEEEDAPGAGQLPNYVHIKNKKSTEDDFEVVIMNDPQNAYLPMPVRYDFPNEEYANNERDKQREHKESKLSILSATAGHGKSAYCINERNIWLQDDSNGANEWVVRLVLPRLPLLSEDPELLEVFTQESTGKDWSEWQLEVLRMDMQDGRVRLLLDGFDEIKDEHLIQRFNVWINKVPLKTDIIVTTRPHAASRVIIPEGRSHGSYLTLYGYNQKQHQEYIEKYIQAVGQEGSRTRIKRSRDGSTISYFDDMANELYRVLESKVDRDVSKLLGIPLESYIFCESLKPHIIEWLTAVRSGQEFNIEDVFEASEKLNMVMLYQRFTYTKLQLFLEKHMAMSLESTLRFPYRVYSFTTSYTAWLMTFAFSQAFNIKEDHFIEQQLSQIYYTREIMAQELPDIGFAALEFNNERNYLRFNHETYQEYFASLFSLRGILLQSGATYEYVASSIKKYRYKTSHRLIIQMIAQASLVGEPLLPGWDKENEEQVIKFWSILFDEGEILGAATTQLFYDCICDLSNAHRVKLRKIFNKSGYNWTRALVNKISEEGEIKHIGRRYVGANIVEDIEEEFPVLLNVNDEDQDMQDEVTEDRETIKRNLLAKSIVVRETRSLLASHYNPSDLAGIFAEIIQEDRQSEAENVRGAYTGLNWYWDIDGGFLAMAMLKDAFNEDMAKYFVCRINIDPSWRISPALEAISRFFKPSLLVSQALDAYIKVIVALINFEDKEKKMTPGANQEVKDRVLLLVRRAPTQIFNYLNIEFNREIDSRFGWLSMDQSSVSTETDSFKKFLQEYFSVTDTILQEPIRIFRNAMWIASKFKYAVFVHEKRTVSIEGDIDTYITIENTNVDLDFEEIVFRLKEKAFEGFSDQELVDNCEESIVDLLEDRDKFKDIFNFIKYRERFFDMLRKHEVINKYAKQILDLIVDNPEETLRFYKGLNIDSIRDYAPQVFDSVKNNNGYILQFWEILCKRKLVNDELEDITTEIFHILKDKKEEILRFYRELSDNDLITEHTANLFINKLRKDREGDTGCYQRYDHWWSLDAGINIAGFLGKYFNQEIANYLILRAGYWKNNKNKAVEALVEIHKTLNAENNGETYSKAIEAYNLCIQRIFSGDKFRLRIIDNNGEVAMEDDEELEAEVGRGAAEGGGRRDAEEVGEEVFVAVEGGFGTGSAEHERRQQQAEERRQAEKDYPVGRAMALYNNHLLNYGLGVELVKRGAVGVYLADKLGADREVAEQLLELAEARGSKVVVDSLFTLLSDSSGVQLLNQAFAKQGASGVVLILQLSADGYAEQLVGGANSQGVGAVIDLLFNTGSSLPFGYVPAESPGYTYYHTDLIEDGLLGEAGAAPSEADGDERLEDKVITYHIPSSSNLDDDTVITPLLILGSTIVKLVETKEAFRYIFSEVIPINIDISFNINFIIGTDDAEGGSSEEQQQDQAGDSDNPYQLELYDTERGGLETFVSEHGGWIGLHLIGGMAVSFSFYSEQVGLAEKILAPVISSSSYASRHLYHSHVKQQILGEEYANSCMMNILADSAFGAMTSLPYSLMTGSPVPVIYGTVQAAAISGIGCLSSSHPNNDESSYISSTAANIVTAGSVVYSYQQGALTLTFTSARDAIFSISKIATTASIASLVHRTTKATADVTYNWWYGESDSDVNDAGSAQLNLAGEIELDANVVP